MHVLKIGITVCSVALVACVKDGASNSTLTLQLKNNEGNLEYCDSDGECTTLPYDGDCAVVEVEIDQATGTTCERCVDGDGDVTDSSCTDTMVGCLLLTLPEPDCLVCAYVNGAVFFSTCVVRDTPECYVDADCTSDDGRIGFCAEGYCVDESGCLDDDDCPTGFVCERLETFRSVLPELWYGTCVPREVACDDDTPCPGDMYCERWCYAAGRRCETSDSCPDNFECREKACWPTDCDSSDADCGRHCGGICQPIHQNPCKDMDCATGTHCEVVAVDCSTKLCRPSAKCVPDFRGCIDDDGCPEGFACNQRICPAMPCTEERCPPCYGICEPVDGIFCEADEDCASDEVCELFFDFPDCDTNTAGCFDPGLARGICVAAPPPCEKHEDCAADSGKRGYCVEGECIYQFHCGASQAVCDMVPPTCPKGQVITVIDGCFGPCVEPSSCDSTQSGCRTNEDCPSLHECLVYCSDCFGHPNCTPHCDGVCVPVEPECTEGEPCTLAHGRIEGTCIDGRCEVDDILCSGGGGCPSGLMCVEVCDPTCDPVAGDTCDPQCWGLCLPLSEHCHRTGCSGEVCSDREVVTICEWRPEYACFHDAVCTRQESGECGWTETPEFEQCVSRARHGF
jgi:hypothetical protein